MIFGIDEKPRTATALIHDSFPLTYGRINDLINEVRHALNGRCLIFSICKNVPEAVAGYLAFLEQGSVQLLLSDGMDEEQLSVLDGIYRPAYYWRQIRKGEECLLSCGSYGLVESRWKSSGMETMDEKLHPDLALLLSSSGSTGSPKLIRLSRKNLESNAASIARYLELDENERPITTLPMHYTFGLSVINSHLSAGAGIIMTESSFVQQEFWDTFEKYRATSISGVPYTYELLKRIHFTERTETESLRTMVQAGGHLPESLQEYYGKWSFENGKRFFVMYGQTEATARMSYLPWDMCLKKIGSIGIAIPGGEFSITEGELVYRGDNVSLGYAENLSDLSLGDERRGILFTGDLAEKDEDGYYRIVGRKSRFLKIFGNRVGLDECEHILEAKEPVAEWACTGCDDRLVIYTNSKNWEEAPQWLADRLNLNGKTFSAVYIDGIPKTETGKKDYKKLK